ncbi:MULTISPECIES: hypothetical protein [Dietzia]|jgi:hypothetical protein|uniref:hypothetical protein n=1 Tax=Dietzia TaxID=37914 RepID=UPI002117A134|nr:hypothetical protein [Dietzia sp. Die43]
MDPRQDSDPGVDTAADETAPVTPDDSGPPENREPGQSSADVITMCLFGAMVLIASVCFVIW